MRKAAEVRLINRAKRGDGAAVEELIRAHQASLYAFMLRNTGRPDVAEDVVQEAFVRVLKNLDRFDPRFRFSTWLFTIAKRLYMNQLQKHSPHFDSEVLDLWQGGQTPPDGPSIRDEVHGNLRRALDDALLVLTKQQREIVMLFHQQNWSIAAIAEHLDMPEGTIKSHLHRARKRMKRAMTADAETRAQLEEVWS